MNSSVSDRKEARAGLRLRLLSFSTGDMLRQALMPIFSEAGFAADITTGDFGVVIPELLAPPPQDLDAILVQTDVRGLFTRDWRRPAEEAGRLLDEQNDMFFAALEKFIETCRASVFVNTLAVPASPTAGFLDPFHGDGQRAFADRFNHRLGEIAARSPRLVLIDTDHALAEIAPTRRFDAKLWFYGRVPYSMEATKALACGFCRALVARSATPAKVLALDLDNTLWRGVYGEDGIDGLDCGDDFPGNAFKAFQQECLRLKSQGLLLVALSKNNPDAIEVFERHPGMALRRDDFVAHRINWEPKPDNIREIANELDLGLDSFVFIDDSPHERDAMRRLAPEVRVPELPDDPALRPDFLRNYVPTWPLRLTAEDRARSELYAVQSKGRQLERQAASFEDYLSQLGQNLHVEAMTSATLARVAQMHARTNQFNLTTRRLSEDELTRMMADAAGHLVLLGRLDDRFGDHGIIICATARMEKGEAEIISLLMSCRVIGRTVERAFLDVLIDELVKRGAVRIRASFLPTKKNMPARDFYSNMGFAAIDPLPDDGEGVTRWLWEEGVNARPGHEFVNATVARGVAAEA